MIKKILLIFNILLLTSCASMTIDNEVTSNNDDISVSMNDHDFIIQNNNSNYLISLTYKVGNILTQSENEIVLRPNETVSINYEVYPSVYSLSEFTYYKFDYSLEYVCRYEDNIAYITIDEDNYNKVKEVLKNEDKLSSLLNNYYDTYIFNFDYKAIYNNNDKAYKVYCKDELISTLKFSF